MSTTRQWGYSASVSTTRRAALESTPQYEELVECVIADATNIRVRVAPGRDEGMTDCLQPVFSFELPTTGDRIFNGAHGYRAQYWHSPARGLTANAALIQGFSAKLLSILDDNFQEEFAGRDARVALRATSAKFWIQEIPSLLVAPTQDLNVQPWLTEAQRGIQLAQWGVCAPEPTRFDIKGALLDRYGNEVVPARKILRHYDIHAHGFS